MARFLLLSDLHLSTTGPERPPSVPPIKNGDVDAVLSLGDLIDDNSDHIQDPEAGQAYEQRGRAFFKQLDGVGVPVIAIPGNHDPIDYTRRLTDGLANIHIAHQRTTKGESLASPALDGFDFVGWGCEQFDLTPTFQYDQYPQLIPDLTNVANAKQVAEQTATTVETVIGQFLAGMLDANAAATELGLDPSSRDRCGAELETVSEEFEAIRSLLPEHRNRERIPVILAHESPFGVSFDFHHSAEGLRRLLHQGSIPLKMAILDAAPDVVFCGHTHQTGRDAIKSTDGYVELYNPGSPGAIIVEILEPDGSLHIESG